MIRSKRIAILVAGAGALAVAACSPQRQETETVTYTPEKGAITHVNGVPVADLDASSGAMGTVMYVSGGDLADTPPNDMPTPAPRKGWTYRHLTQVEGCFIGVMNYDGHEALVTSGRSQGSSWPIACGVAPLQ